MSLTYYTILGDMGELWKRSKVKNMLGYVPDEYFALENGMLTTFSEFDTTQALTDKLVLRLAAKSKMRAAIFVSDGYKDKLAELGKINGINDVVSRETFNLKAPKNFEGHPFGYFELLLATAYDSIMEGVCRR